MGIDNIEHFGSYPKNSNNYTPHIIMYDILIKNDTIVHGFYYYLDLTFTFLTKFFILCLIYQNFLNTLKIYIINRRRRMSLMGQDVKVDSAQDITAGSDAPFGSVLVVGGGIAGVQSALDLADSGFKVYLLDSSASIGGTMAQLDKTFPTNDCSMCILSPKLVEVGRHPNIELLMLSEVTGLKGKAGNFKVKVLKHARYVDEEKCTGCGVCSDNCLVKYEFQIPEPTSVRDQLLETDLQKLNSILASNDEDQAALIPVLQDINNEFNYLPEDALRYVSERLNVPLSQIYHVATFYTAFSLTPRGEHSIKVCQGTACHVKGGARVLSEIERILNITSGETTSDLRFTLETVNCLGCCALGPVVVIDDEYHPITPDKVNKLIKKYEDSGEGGNP